MTVRELLKRCLEENLDAEVVVVLGRYRSESFRTLKSQGRGYFDEVTVDGTESEGLGKVLVLIAGRDE